MMAPHHQPQRVCCSRSKAPHWRRLQANARTRTQAAVAQASPLAPSDLQAGCVVHARPYGIAGNEESSGVYLEVIKSWDSPSQSCTAAWAGRMLRLSLASDGADPAVIVEQTGVVIGPTSPLAASFPGWAAALTRLEPALRTPLPFNPRLPLAACRVAGSLSQLQAEVAASPARWCQGSGPGEPPPSGLAFQQQTAGEILALMMGSRGLVMVQLHAGWDAALPQPAFHPHVITLLARVAADRDLTITICAVQGGLGLTALLSTRKDPWRAWARHMASFGAQAGLVAGSPYYALLIGRMLGYPDAHIEAHITAQAAVGKVAGELTSAVVAAVDADLAKLSRKKPTLPWNASSRGKSGGVKRML